MKLLIFLLSFLAAMATDAGTGCRTIVCSQKQPWPAPPQYAVYYTYDSTADWATSFGSLLSEEQANSASRIIGKVRLHLRGTITSPGTVSMIDDDRTTVLGTSTTGTFVSGTYFYDFVFTTPITYAGNWSVKWNAGGSQQWYRLDASHYSYTVYTNY